MTPAERATRFPLGAAVTLEELERDPHPTLARLRSVEPVSWITALDGWLVTRRDLALEVMRDEATYTVDDPRFSTARVVGPSMLSLDGIAHRAHRDPFAKAFRLAEVRSRFTELVELELERLLDLVEPVGRAELRRDLAGPLSVATMVHALGLGDTDARTALGWYAAIVADVTAITAGKPVAGAGTRAFAELRDAVEAAMQHESSLVAEAGSDTVGLTRAEVASNAGVLLFGGIETTEAMIVNAFVHLLSSSEQLATVRADGGLLNGVVEESLRLEPAAAVVDRYATRDTMLGDVAVCRGDMVTVSLAGANRDPAVFPDPDRFDPTRDNVGLHVAFAHGPHVCFGMHLARVEARCALAAALARFSHLRLDPARPSRFRGLVFRKPDEVHVLF